MAATSGAIEESGREIVGREIDERQRSVKPEPVEPAPADLAERDAVRSSRVDAPREWSSDWGSLVGDLSKGEARPSWRIHDRTHVEFGVDYPIASGAGRTEHEWEAYFFIPESLRVDETTYGKNEIYADLQSYVRFAVPDVPFGQLAGEPLSRIREVVGEVVAGGDSAALVRELRLFACLVRAAGVATRRSITDALLDEDPKARSRALAATARMVADARRVTGGLREALVDLPDDDTLVTAAAWVDEDISRLLETLMGSLSVRLRKADAPESLVTSVVDSAVGEACYRERQQLHGIGRVGASKRQAEHLEFRRHVLKRFTSSVLWLKPEVREGARVVLQVLYAVAAGVAMAFAVVAALWNGLPESDERIWMWAVMAVLAYMGKDRIKASLQNVFSKVVSRHFPDRRWRIRDRERSVVLGEVDEQSAFVPFKDLPAGVLERRRTTRRHPLEEQARPEKVLWHRKLVRIDPDQVALADQRFDALTEIFRLDLRRWLVHTDDPKRKIVYADPDQHRVLSAFAPRVYNLGIVYRLRSAGQDAPWHRIRVVVSRKGIRRIDHIDADTKTDLARVPRG